MIKRARWLLGLIILEVAAFVYAHHYVTASTGGCPGNLRPGVYNCPMMLPPHTQDWPIEAVILAILAVTVVVTLVRLTKKP